MKVETTTTLQLISMKDVDGTTWQLRDVNALVELPLYGDEARWPVVRGNEVRGKDIIHVRVVDGQVENVRPIEVVIVSGGPVSLRQLENSLMATFKEVVNDVVERLKEG